MIIFCSFLIYGCKKHPDYRDKFLGNYRFAIHLQTWMGIAPPNYSTTDTTYYYNGKIELGTHENTVLIFFTEQSSSNNWYEPFESIIYEDGSLGYSSGGYYLDGDLESINKIKFHLRNQFPGSGFDYYVIGDKQ